MTEEKKELKQCSGCRSFMLLEHFKINRKGEYNKTCISCAETRKKRSEKNKCEHGKRKSYCKECGGGSICPHNRRKSECKECGGVSICPHNRIKSKCKECGGGSFCPHNRQKSYCKECGGGSICPHNRVKSSCKECGGSQVCPHNRFKSECKECDPVGHLRQIVSSRVKSALRAKKSKKSIEYLGCTIDEFKEHIESQFEEGMTWDNHGEWHIDHIVPIKYKEDGEVPTLEDTIKRLHWSNTQPLWASDNIAKGNRFIG